MIFPQVGSWYRRVDKRLFEVVAIDADEGTVELQYFDGTIAELDFEAWHQLELCTAAPPEDWSGSVDMDPMDNAELRDTARRAWQDPLILVDQLD